MMEKNLCAEHIAVGASITEEIKYKRISELSENDESATVVGKIVFKEMRRIKPGVNRLHIYISDGSGALTCRVIVSRGSEVSVLSRGMVIKVSGKLKRINGNKDKFLLVSTVKVLNESAREDRAARKRIELHAHSKFSPLAAVSELREYARMAHLWGHSAIVLTDIGVVQGFHEFAYEAKRHEIKLIYGMEGFLVDGIRPAGGRRKKDAGDEMAKPYNIVILAATQKGLKNLYKLVTVSHIKNHLGQPVITRAELEEHREGLIISPAGCGGEVMKAIAEGREEEDLIRVASFYDYLEINPIIQSFDGDVRAMNRKIYEIGKRLEMPVCATSNSHYLEPEDEIFLKILNDAYPAECQGATSGLYLRTTDEMLSELSYLGEAEAFEVVVENPEKIATMVDKIIPGPEKNYYPEIEGAFETLRGIAVDGAKCIYGQALPEIVSRRLNRELEIISKNGFASLYLLAYEFGKASIENGYPVGFRGSAGSSFILFLAGVTGTNPLA